MAHFIVKATKTDCGFEFNTITAEQPYHVTRILRSYLTWWGLVIFAYIADARFNKKFNQWLCPPIQAFGNRKFLPSLPNFSFQNIPVHYKIILD